MHTAWDLGIGDSTAIWFWQACGGEIRVIDYYENHGKGLDHYVSELATRSHVYGKDFVPHDAKVRELGTGKTRIETLIGLGRKVALVPNHKIMDGINAARAMIPKCWIDAEKCRDGLEALRQYQCAWDDRNRCFVDTPRHDWTSHAADAFRYLAMAHQELRAEIKEVQKPRSYTPLHEMSYDEYGFDGEIEFAFNGTKIITEPILRRKDRV